MKRALVLTDGKAGHENQSRAFARALGLEPAFLRVAYRSKPCKALSYLFSRLGLRSFRLFRLERALPDPASVAVVIGTGSGTFYPALCAARALGVRCGVVLYPRGYALDAFDCVLAPAFDRPQAAANVIPIPANLVANDAAFYAAGAASFRERHACPEGTKAVAVIVGGPNACSTLSADWMKAELARVFAENPDAEKWVTTSRRTPPDVERVVDAFPWDYKLLYSQDHYNPIPGFVACAQRLYVTAESTGMLSECCTAGTAEVCALDNLKPGPHKFRRFLEDLTAGGYLGGNRKIDLSEPYARARRLLGL